MSLIKRLFGQKAEQPVDLGAETYPDAFAEKFKHFGEMLGAVGREMPDKWSKTDPYICAFDRGHQSELKKWIVVNKDSLHIRYHDRDLGKNSGLAVLDIDRAQICYRINKCQEFTHPEDAIEAFVQIISIYADPIFMCALKAHLAQSDVLDFSTKAEDPDKDVNQAEQGKTEMQQAERKRATDPQKCQII